MLGNPGRPESNPSTDPPHDRHSGLNPHFQSPNSFIAFSPRVILAVSASSASDTCEAACHVADIVRIVRPVKHVLWADSLDHTISRRPWLNTTASR